MRFLSSGGILLKSGDCDWGLHLARFSGVGRVSMLICLLVCFSMRSSLALSWSG
jgi:hypothetical protein